MITTFNSQSTEFRKKRILLGHLASFGDCLYATTIAKQIKTDYPNCHLTWAIGSKYRSILNENPHVDEIWEIPLNSRDDIAQAWYKFKKVALERYEQGDFDEIFLTQIYPDNYKTYDGTLRSSILRFYGKPITVGVNPVIVLSEQEVNNVYNFVYKNNLLEKKNIILFECSAKSDQSFVTTEFALELVKILIDKIPDCRIILSSDIPISILDERIIDGSSLSFRENAELTKYCSLLIGCSSGISWLCTSEWAKKLPSIQLLKADKSMYASFIYDHQYHGLTYDHIIEMTDTTAETVAACVIAVIKDGVATARLNFHQDITLDFTFYFQTMAFVLYKRKFKDFIFSLFYTFKRYGFRPNLLKSFLPLIQYIMTLGYQKFLKKLKFSTR
ncbi:glycosyltransferase family 9 protein [Gloeothece verrucosa]|uniref:Glycosyl transferase family 9 n=1 Tax=Gloeothece verrucosa (strain PCC 7822) TaxID=497965 RepID=E0U827_GLOV7|nr:hypothetical protein [Gloeothece verrucosa]ADN17232.1 conserved hypothetical protein [Gloeothece verrucosa PCC 7822]